MNDPVIGADKRGGEKVSFQERLLGQWFHFCGGVVISPAFILTAAHCVEGGDFTSPAGLRVMAGERDLTTEEGTEQLGTINLIIEHPFYDPITYENDIALLRLETPLMDTEFVKSVSLPSPFQNFTGESCRVSGWGRIQEDGASSDLLLYTDLTIINDTQCITAYTHDELFPSMLCAG
ncbi:hypothetical protein Pmani_036040 [Petrolisthes manimaculis]|uniref:Peptidase S1 domain-containing protein n=1 Tax=Petrolisthes manimaculis TaxID=1843537 RepID=A0AAE1TN37_9EUCA|nr:hypothetical protein Pmani_036040 [Petrolisthes manimaculis]